MLKWRKTLGFLSSSSLAVFSQLQCRNQAGVVTCSNRKVIVKLMNGDHKPSRRYTTEKPLKQAQLEGNIWGFIGNTKVRVRMYISGKWV